MADHYRVSKFTYAFASHVHELHKETSGKIVQNNTNYKLRADVRKRLKTFNVGAVKKLYAHSASLFQILKLNNHVYVLDLSKDFGINYTFNVEDIMDY